MKQRTLGRSGLRVSQLGLGTWRWGRDTDPDEAAAILVAFRDAGGTLVDTAVGYQDGAAEQILGGLIADVVPREELVLAGKAGHRWVDGAARVDASRGAMLRDLDVSLRRLQVDHLDLWQVHVPDPDVPIDETLSALDLAVTSGRVRYAGLSNFNGWRTAQAATMQAGRPAGVVSNQVRYSLLDRGVEREVVPACLELGLGVLPFSPLGGGALTGKYRTGIPSDSRAAVGTRHLADLDDPVTIGVVEAVATAAEGLATSPIAISLAWVRDRPGVAAPIVGVRTLGQLTAALASETLDIPAEIRDALDDVSAPPLGYPETVPDLPEVATDPVFAAFCAAGLWPGLGRRLVDELPAAGIHGPGDVTSSNITLLPKVGPQRAGRLLSSFVAAGPAYEVASLLVPVGLDARFAGRAVEIFGPPAPRLLRDDPWRLLAVNGVQPDDADRLARAVIPGVTRDDPRRARALVAWVLAREARDGHTVDARDDVAAALAQFGAGSPEAAVEAALEAATVVASDDGMLGLARYAEAEDGVAHGIARLLATAQPIDVPLGQAASALDEAQRAAVEAALSGGVTVLTGGPGTGKSRTVATLVSLAEKSGKSVALAAPTGRAAKRLEELCDSPASTLHRLLGAQPRQSDDGVRFDGGFARGEDWPLDEDVVVVDEASMLDVELADALLTACSDGTHLVFVGDAAQLPSIGPGRVLGDLIDSGSVAVTELTTLYRQAEGGTIARLATAVREGSLTAVDDPDREVVLVTARGSTEAAHRVVQLVTDSIPRALGIPAEQVQVVTPVHRGPAGTQALNAALKAVLNQGTGRRRFDPGDRVVATANHLEAEPAGYANGEVGVVDSVSSDGTVTVSFASGPAAIKGKALGDLLHGWAITVHRAQGSEFPAVVVVLPPEAGRLMSRPLVYTALTRAQRHLSIVHAAGPAVARAVRLVGALPRRTRLMPLLQEYVQS